MTGHYETVSADAAGVPLQTMWVSDPVVVDDLEPVLPPQDNVPRVLGIDPSWTATGIAHVDGSTTTIKYPKGVERDWRLAFIHQEIETILRWEMPTHVVIEELVANKWAAGTGVGMPQGVIRLALMNADVPYLALPPSTLKKLATGRGNAVKSDIRMALYQRTGLDLADDNQVDAWWLREAGLQLLGVPTVSLPKLNLDALNKWGFR